MQRQVNQAVVLRDGVRLATDIYLPDGPGPFPVILNRTPYDRTHPRYQKKAGIYTAHGLAVVIQDVRATGQSSATAPFYPWKNEGADGQEVLRWVAAQSFCNGRVGTHGGSYLATSQWLAAPAAPDCLKCMMTYVGPHNFYDGYYTRGVHHLLITLAYGLFMSGAVTDALGGWPAMHKRYWHLPVCDADLFEGKHNPFFQDMVLKPAGDSHWRFFDPLADPSQIKVPVLQQSGWFDFYTRQAFRAWEVLRNQGGSAAARNGSKILVGPWAHDRAGSRCADVDFGPNACLDLYGNEIRWYKHWLMDERNGIETEPPLRLFTMGKNSWEDFADWPAPDAFERPLFLHSRGHANTLHGDGGLTWEKPGTESTDHFQYNPLDPTPTVGGNHSCDFAEIPAGPMDQTQVELRQDVLVYSSEILREPLAIAGPIRARLYAASNAPDTDFTAKLVDVQIDGGPINLSEGITRASCRESVIAPSAIEPGKVYEYTIDLVDLSHVFLPGHRVRLEISSSNFPKYVRNLNTGQNNHTTSETQVAEQTIFHDTAHPSALLLWVRPSE